MITDSDFLLTQARKRTKESEFILMMCVVKLGSDYFAVCVLLILGWRERHDRILLFALVWGVGREKAVLWNYLHHRFHRAEINTNPCHIFSLP